MVYTGFSVYDCHLERKNGGNIFFELFLIRDVIL